MLVERFRLVDGYDSPKTLQFFFDELLFLVPKSRVSKTEVLYVAEVLANYAQTSRGEIEDFPLVYFSAPQGSSEFVPPAASLSEVHEAFVLSDCHSSLGRMENSEILEIAGSQVLLLAGFFRGQVSRKVNIHYYDKLGHSFYYKAAHFCSDTTRARLLMTMSVRLTIWLQVCYKLHKEFRKNRLYSPEFRREN